MHPIKAISWFFKILLHGEEALPKAIPSEVAPVAVAPVAEPPKPAFTASTEQAIQLLGLLQKEGRLIDFLQEDITGFSDEEIGGAVRDIHKGCAKVLKSNLVLRRVIDRAEGSAVEVPVGFDPSAIALQGNVTGGGPFRGTLRHAGWYVDSVKLPTTAAGADPRVAAPAQVEV